MPKPPVWFTIVAIVLILWGLMGGASLYIHFAYGADIDPNATPYDRQLYDSMPLWVNAAYVLAVGGGLVGAVALLLKRQWAVILSAVSLGAVVVQFGYMFLATDIIAIKGVWTTYFPASIFVAQLFQLWFANLAKGKGWLR